MITNAEEVRSIPISALTESEAKVELESLAKIITAYDKSYYTDSASTVSDDIYYSLRRRNEQI